jgi:hypothetical protein
MNDVETICLRALDVYELDVYLVTQWWARLSQCCTWELLIWQSRN